jgi:hypothetical protein
MAPVHPRTSSPAGPDEYDCDSKESDMHVLEVRNAELMDSITRQAAERGITFTP